MTADHLTKGQRRESELFLGHDGSWGLGLRVPAAGERGMDIPGGFGWDGGAGTTWRSDVERDLTGILFTQRAMTSPEPPEVFTDFWDCAYGAIDDC
jgi:CubicO group peptidase (beta-lactamase class C family)